MEKAISATYAKRKFALILRRMREGHSYVVTSHGRPLAHIIPAANHKEVASGARTALLSRLEIQPPINVGSWGRDELYDDGQC
jgi:prevent-host-death family protein